MDHVTSYLEETAAIARQLDGRKIDELANALVALRERGGRLFVLGTGGGAGHASHAVCDFRKLCGIEAYTPADNVSELTARTNDEGWDAAYVDWLRASRLRGSDMLLVFSVGGGDAERNISRNLVRAMELGRELGCVIAGVVGRDGGFTATVADICILVPSVNPERITVHTEAFQAVVWHLLVCDPRVATSGMKWETTTRAR